MPAKKPVAKPAKTAKAASAKKMPAKLSAKSTSKMTAKPVPKSTVAKPAAKKSAAIKAADKPAAKPVSAPAKPVSAPAKPVGKPAPPKPAVVLAPVEAAPPTANIASMPVANPAPPRALRPDGPIAIATSSRSARPAAETAEGDEGDGSDLNLLAGPRNVTPYISKRGEIYMSKEQLDHFRQILGNWKSDLMREVDRTVSHMKDEAANFPDPNDRATQEEEFSLELRTRDRERKLIRKIDEALQRIEDGSYGYCLETGEEIGIKRLEARPVATLSLEAQERRERREKQYGDRDDRYR
jgi:DnaK suppressor protein